MAPPTPKISRSLRIPLIWIVPIVALGVASWMLYREWRSHGTEITVEFADGSGLEPGETKLEYKGVAVGKVKRVRLDHNLRTVIVRLQLERNASAIAREGARFWIVEPEISFGGVSGLETLLSGVHLGVSLGTGKPATHFVGLEAPPALENKDDGPAFLLRTEQLGGLQLRAPVFYRDVKVGMVEAARLADDAASVLIRIRVQEAYARLIHTNTRFWNAGGAPLQISLFGGGTRQRSLQSVVTGAIAFATPEEVADVAADGAQFSLYKEPADEWLKWHPQIFIKAPDAEIQKPAGPKNVPALLGSGG